MYYPNHTPAIHRSLNLNTFKDFIGKTIYVKNFESETIEPHFYNAGIFKYFKLISYKLFDYNEKTNTIKIEFNNNLILNFRVKLPTQNNDYEIIYSPVIFYFKSNKEKEILKKYVNDGIIKSIKALASDPRLAKLENYLKNKNN